MSDSRERSLRYSNMVREGGAVSFAIEDTSLEGPIQISPQSLNRFHDDTAWRDLVGPLCLI